MGRAASRPVRWAMELSPIDREMWTTVTRHPHCVLHSLAAKSRPFFLPLPGPIFITKIVP